MNILLTGANGFLGRHIYDDYIKHHKIDTIGRSNSTINVDLGQHEPILPNVYGLVIHAAGKAHSVPKTPEQKQAFFNVNVTGTINLLKSLEISGIPKAFVFISTVAVYGKETGNLINENSPLLAADAYGKSKIGAENIISDWCAKNNVICAILRLPLIAGANPPGNLKAMINGIKKGYYFNIDGGKARKSIVLAADVAKIIPVAADIGGVYNLTDQYHPGFLELSVLIARQLEKSRPFNMPLWIAAIIAKAGDLMGPKAPLNSAKLKKITTDLTFDDSKAQKLLRWEPNQVLKAFKIE